jgi:uncharacterized protein YcbK (DUF882 family)
MDYSSLISSYFTVHEALWLPSWGRHAEASDGLTDSVLSNLKSVFSKMDKVREYFGHPILVHVAYRPQKYNELVKGAANSSHMALEPGVAAVDFHIQGISCDEVKKAIFQNGKLNEWDLRMEDNGFGANWVHLDTRQVLPGHLRFFKP